MSRQQNYSVSSPLPTPRHTWSRCSSSSHSRATLPLSGDLKLHLSKRGRMHQSGGLSSDIMIGFFLFYFIFYFFSKNDFFHFHPLWRKWKMVSRIIRVFCRSSDTNTSEESGTDQRVQLCPGMPSRLCGECGCERLSSMSRPRALSTAATGCSSQSASRGGVASPSSVQLSDSRLNAALSDKSVCRQYTGLCVSMAPVYIAHRLIPSHCHIFIDNPCCCSILF